MKTCQNCGKPVASASRGAKYCSNACRTDAYRKRHSIAPPAFLQRKRKAFLSPDEEREVQRLQREIQNYEKVISPLEEEYSRRHKTLLLFQTYGRGESYNLDNSKRDIKAQIIEILDTTNCPNYSDVKRDAEKYETKISQLEKELLTRQRRVVKILDGAKARESVKRTSRGVMTGADLVNMKFDTLPLVDHWGELVGHPAQNFYAIVWGDAKAGKSYFSLGFAQYLTHFGKVAYIATEEGISETLRKKVADVGALDVEIVDTKELKEMIPRILDANFVFIDSGTKIGLEPEDVSFLRESYPDTAFIILLQSVKDGANFKGDQQWKHDVDMVLSVEKVGPKSTKVMCRGRYGNGEYLYSYDSSSKKSV
jgi:hypothetical protein